MTLRRYRQGALFALLIGVSAWGLAMWRADNHVFAWDRPVSVLIAVVLDPRVDHDDDVLRGFLTRFLSKSVSHRENLAGIEFWFQREHERWTGPSPPPIALSSRGPIAATEPPPLPPPPDAPFLERWRSTRQFLQYFETIDQRENLARRGYDATIVVYFYDEADAPRYTGQHSVASRRDRLGVVFSAVGPRHFARCAAVVAHELCHTLGASDKYEGQQCTFPDGYADPHREPLYPQDRAEIMGLGIPLGPGVERRVEGLDECVVGRKTAEEVGWVAAGGGNSSGS